MRLLMDESDLTPIKKIKLLFLIRFFSPHFLVLLLFHIIYIFGLCSPFPPYFQFLSCVIYIYFFPLERKVRKVTKLGTFFLLYISHPQNVWYWTDVLMYLHFHLFTRGSNFHFLFFFSFFADNWQKHWQGCCCVHNYNVFYFFSE